MDGFFLDNYPTLTLVDAGTNETWNKAKIDEMVLLIEDELDECKVGKGDILYISLKRELMAIVAVLTCLNRRIPFTFCPYNYEKNGYTDFCTTVELGLKNCITRHREKHQGKELERDLCYIITTSGSTGIPKRVLVNWHCIWANVDDFCETFMLSRNDRILLQTSFSFDPSIVEMFSAFKCQSKLILIPDEYRSRPTLLNDCILSYRPTFAQFTPTVFKMLPDLSRHLGPDSYFHVLLIGGSEFPLSTVKRYRSEDNMTRIYDVYGVTEISCWATIFEVTFECEEVLMGRNIRGTEVTYEKQGPNTAKILIGGSRNDNNIYDTGDIVYTDNNKIRFAGRVDGWVKFNDEKLSLSACRDKAILSCQNLKDAHFMIFREKILIVFMIFEENCPRYVVEEEVKQWKEKMRVHVIILTSFPLTKSGKPDERKFNELAFNMYSDLKNFDKFFRKTFGSKFEDVQFTTFKTLGIDSFKAACFSLYYKKSVQELVIRTLLDGRTVVSTFFERFRKFASGEVQKDYLEKELLTNIMNIGGLVERCQPKIKWAHDLGKCIDATPVLVELEKTKERIVVVAAYNGRIIAVNFDDGSLKWEQHFPESSFQLPVSEVDGDVVIGCHNGHIYRLDGRNGELIWHYPGEPQFQKCPIRTRFVYDGQQFLYYCQEGFYFNVLDAHSGEIIASRKLGHYSRATPIITKEGLIIVVDFRGTVYVYKPGPFVGRIGIAEPKAKSLVIFSDPLYFSEINSILFLDIRGRILLCQYELVGKGDEMIANVKFVKEKLIDSSFDSSMLCIQENVVMIGTTNGFLLYLSVPSLEIQQVLKFTFDGFSIVRNAQLLPNNRVIIQSINGICVIFNMISCRKVRAFRVARNIYIEPLIIGGKMVVASRDDYLKCFDL